MTLIKARYFKPTVFICVCGSAILALVYMSAYIDSATTVVTMNLREMMFPKLELKCPIDAMLCGGETLREQATSSDFNTLRSKFHRLVTTIDFRCAKLRRFGRANDGGYEACMSEDIEFNNSSCLVYSFGINRDWSFDEAWSRYGCEVHSFDPRVFYLSGRVFSIGKEDHIHPPNVSFHNLGIWGNDITNSKGWRLERLSTIRKRLGHEERILDAVKMDVEGAEWPFLRDIIYNDPTTLSNVRQLYIEVHTPKFRFEGNMTAVDFAEISDYVGRLRDVYNFKLYKNVRTNDCCGKFSGLMPPGVHDKCCHELFFINPRLLRI